LLLSITKWFHVVQVESIVLSIISMLSSPNDESPANIEAAVSALNIIFFLIWNKFWKKIKRHYNLFCCASRTTFLSSRLSGLQLQQFVLLIDSFSRLVEMIYNVHFIISRWIACFWCSELSYRRIGEKERMISRKRLGHASANLRKCSERGDGESN
jgi:hypothetical protein